MNKCNCTYVIVRKLLPLVRTYNTAASNDDMCRMQAKWRGRARAPRKRATPFLVVK